MSESTVTVDGFSWVEGPAGGSDNYCRKDHLRRKPWNRDGIRWRRTEKRWGWVWVRRDPVATILDGAITSRHLYVTPLSAMRGYAKAVKP